LKTAVAISGGLAVSALAGQSEAASYLDGVIYTKQNPGMWKGKEGGHAPIVAKEGNKVTVTTKHVMTAQHFIVRHTIVDEYGKVLGSKTFTPADKEAVSTYELPDGFKGGLYVTSFCNLHDLWVTKIDV